jgi:alanine dehydrogenase
MILLCSHTRRLADQGLEALTLDFNLAKGVNVRSGKIVHPAVREAAIPNSKSFDLQNARPSLDY